MSISPGDGRADAIAVNEDTVSVRRNTGHDFGPGPQVNEDWTHGRCYGTGVLGAAERLTTARGQQNLYLACPFARGERLIKNEGAPTGVRGLQFHPARNGSGATCLWEADSVEDVQGYVDSTLGDASEYLSYEVDAEHAFARQPLGISDSAAIGA